MWNLIFAMVSVGAILGHSYQYTQFNDIENETISLNMESVFYLPESEFYSPQPETETAVILLSNNVSSSHNSEQVSISKSEILQVLKDTIKSNFKNHIQKRQINNLRPWSDASCCRLRNNIQARVRIYNGFLEIQSRRCSSNYCTECRDTLKECSYIKDNFNACNSYLYRGFMSQFCPKICGICPSTPLVVKPFPSTGFTVSPTQAPAYLQEVKVYFYPFVYPFNYKYSISSNAPNYPWRPAQESGIRGEVSSFYLSTNPTQIFRLPVYFCKYGRDRIEYWQVRRSPCQQGWSQEFLLFASLTSFPGSQTLYVSTDKTNFRKSRINRSPSVSTQYGYGPLFWQFFSSSRGFVPPTQPPTRPTANTPIFPAPIRTTNNPFATTRPITQPTSVFEKECLDRHNFYRALHNSPPLTWNPTLAASAQAWAERLKRCVPDSPENGREKCGLQSFPHSPGRGIGRPPNTGENIAWDYSSDGSSARETVLRWYSEVFDYNRRNPTKSLGKRPIGHFTQLLWKNTKSIGCGRAVTTTSRGNFIAQSTWTVSQYAPTGNIRYPSFEETVSYFQQQVPQLRSGACRSPTNCPNGFGCIGTDSSYFCSCSGSSSTPICRGSTGKCLASCPVPDFIRSQSFSTRWIGECEGRTSCRCSYTSVNGRRGAICD